MARLLSPNDIKKLWPHMQPELFRLCQRYPADAEPVASIEAKLADGTYRVLLLDGYVFAIVMPRGTNLFVTTMAAFGGVTPLNIRDIISSGIEQVKQWGFCSATFGSPRPGWQRVLKPLGFCRVDDEFTKEFYEIT